MALRFEGMHFPAYVYQEYPKAVNCPDGRQIVVKDAYEERALIASFPTNVVDETITSTVPNAEIISDNSEEISKASVWARADELGIIYDKRWNIRRVMDAIAATEAQTTEEVSMEAAVVVVSPIDEATTSTEEEAVPKVFITE